MYVIKLDIIGIYKKIRSYDKKSNIYSICNRI